MQKIVHVTKGKSKTKFIGTLMLLVGQQKGILPVKILPQKYF